MTDRRLAQDLPRIVAAMPPRSGVIIRPHAMDAEGRHRLIVAVRRVGRAKRHCMLIADRRMAGFDGVHAGGPMRTRACHRAARILSMPVHNHGEARAAARLGADLWLVSPVHPTRSHAGAPAIGARGFARLAATAAPGARAIALGGMDSKRFRRLRYHGAEGWAAIDAWQPRG